MALRHDLQPQSAVNMIRQLTRSKSRSSHTASCSSAIRHLAALCLLYSRSGIPSITPMNPFAKADRMSRYPIPHIAPRSVGKGSQNIPTTASDPRPRPRCMIPRSLPILAEHNQISHAVLTQYDSSLGSSLHDSTKVLRLPV